jgi:hypothetical protein
MLQAGRRVDDVLRRRIETLLTSERAPYRAACDAGTAVAARRGLGNNERFRAASSRANVVVRSTGTG